MNKLLEQFNDATALMTVGRLEEALESFLELEENPEFAPFCYYRIAQISNMIGEPEEAYELYYKAFTAMPNIASRMLSEDHTSFNYIFRGKKSEKVTTKCPLCGVESSPHWCYSLIEAAGYNEFFNPVRMWMFCYPCNHMFAREFPEKLFLYNDSPRKANPVFFPYYSNVLASIRRNGYAEGMTLFEVGIGACECLLAAREIGYEAFGIDVIERHVEDAKSKYSLDAEAIDFLEFESDRKWDIIIMGDVLEHVSDPELALAKAESLLHDNGALWISTPTFESAFSCVAGHNDVMRKQQYHLNYFSRESLYTLLERNYLFPVDYQISAHFNGSMEVIAVKESRA
ncbi:MAG: methyltransferase domain-containing protein [Oscillospiraceae bacterium]|nr:methyltransferase domain-containing protein [Oscillospiraceae bacterium]